MDLTVVTAEAGCLHRDEPRKGRLARKEVEPGLWQLKCGCVIPAHVHRGNCPTCKGKGTDPNGCCGDLCPAGCNFGEVL